MRSKQRIHGRDRIVAARTAPRAAVQGSGIRDQPSLTPWLQELQRTVGNHAVARLLFDPATRRARVAGQVDDRSSQSTLPDPLKRGVESLSGVALDDVRVHYNSDKPAQVDALAFARGTDIHIAPGQERHLAHEAWHVVQQAQGRVRPTFQTAGGVTVNDEPGLEHEADVMGQQALRMPSALRPRANRHDAIGGERPMAFAFAQQSAVAQHGSGGAAPMQRESKKTSEERAPGSKDTTVDAIDGAKLVYDTFDQTLTLILPAPNANGIQGYQFTYELDNKPDAPPMITGFTLKAELSPTRVTALKVLSARQGGVQEDAVTGPAGRKLSDETEGKAAREKTALDNEKLMKEYTAKVAALKEGDKPPAPPKLKPPPEDKKTTLCNDFPVEIATAIGVKVPDKQKGGASKVVDDGKLRNFDPRTEGLKRGSWRTLDTQPDGPKPGDVYSLGLAKNPEAIQHLGVLKSRRTGAPGTEIWTVVDGGQGSYASQQKILERTRTYHLDTHLLTTMLADAGQDASDRSLRGWIDIEAHFKTKDPADTPPGQ